MQNIFLTNETDLLDKIVQNQVLHARFLNTLSFMELSGAQRISRVMAKLPSSTFLLEHIAEEYRHAFYLRRLAHKLGNDSESYENVFCKKVSNGYIRNLDKKIALLVNKNEFSLAVVSYELPYLLTTLVIEKRALPFYNLYQSVLDNHGIALSVKSVISEEEKHLYEMETMLGQKNIPSAMIEKCLIMENESFRAWMAAIASTLSTL